MKRAVRKMSVIGVFAGMLAGMVFGIGTPRIAEGHTGGDGTFHVPKPPQNLQVTGIAGNNNNAAVVSWDAGHSHPGTPFALTGYLLSITVKEPLPEDGEWPSRCIETSVIQTQDPDCVSRWCKNQRQREIPCGLSTCPPSRWGIPIYSAPISVCPLVEACTVTRNTCSLRSPLAIPGTASHTEIITGLTPGTPYYVRVTARYADTQTGGATGSVTIFDTETPDPETPEPETPDPVTPGCSYKHRLIGVPGTTGAGYTGQILISSEDSKATVNIRAYQKDNGAPIDVLDSEGSAIGSSVSLSPANSVKQFRLEEIRGWHIVIVEHPSKAAMENATVAMRLREPDTGVSIELAERIEQCTTAATTAD